MTSADATIASRPRALPAWKRLLLSEYLVLVLTVLYFVVMWTIVPEIAAADTLLDILSAMMPLLVVAIGQTFVLIVAGIDLSAPSIIAMASVVGASVMTGDAGYANGTGFEIIAGILAFIAVGSVIGTFNGVCTTRFNMPSFIVTLTTMMFFSGAAIWYTTVHTDASSIGNLPRGFIEIGPGTCGRFARSRSLSSSSSAGVAHFILSRTVYGRWLYAVGLNPKAAAVSGVPVRKVIFWAFVISGVCAAISSILYTGRLETGTPVLGQRILLDVVGAAVIGGVSLFGGKGKILWTIFGVLFLTVIDKSLQLMGLSHRLGLRHQGQHHPRGRDHRRAAPPPAGARMTAHLASQHASAATGVPLLEIEGLCKSFFGVEVLHKVGFSLQAGRVLGLVGENGSGKSTTMNIIGGVHQMDAGRITFDGADYRPQGPARRRAPGHRLHPSGTEPVPQSQHRREPVHHGVPQAGAGAALHRPRRRAQAGRRTAGRRRSRPLAHDAGQQALAGRAPAGRDRQGAGRQGQGHHLRRADDLAHDARDRPAVRHHQQAARARHRDHLHQPHSR